MKFLVVIFALCVAVSYATVESAFKVSWEGYKNSNKKKYRDSTEESKRYKNWKSNSDFVEKHNAEADSGLQTFWVAMNKYGDLNGDEFARVYYGVNMTMYKRSAFKPAVFSQNVNLPTSVDWRTKGYVTPVKDQGECGSCWAFSATGALEGQYFKTSGKLVSLSDQNLVDCSFAQGNQGCNGGWMGNAFEYIKVKNGINTQASYPYTAKEGKCVFNASKAVAKCTGSVDIKSNDEKALQQAVATIGPVSVAIDASRSSFQLYSKGIYYDKTCSATNLNHGVLVVGYGSLGKNKDYWIVKNSWGTGWGDKGYILMARNRKNNCGIATAALYPTV